MRLLAAFLLLAALAVAFALLARTPAGYVQIVLPPLRVEMSFFVFVIAALGAFLALYGAMRLVAHIVAMPREVRAHRSRQQLERARARQDAALVALLEGRYNRARELAEEALALPRSGGLPALLGARAALDMRDFATAATLLARSDARVTSLAVPRLMLEAELALEQGQAGEALARLDELKREAGAHTAALRLSLRTLNAAGRSAEVPGVVDQLVRRGVYDADQGALLRASAQGERLASLALDAAGLRDAWNRMPEADRLHPRVALAAAASFARLGGDREAVDILTRSLERHWDPALVALFGECRPADVARQLEVAEGWLAAHRDDAVLLATLGRVCERAGLWGKAQSYYEASLAVDDHWRARVMLGSLLVRLGRGDDANAHLAAALKLALAELGEPGLADR
ncbi:MAG TPA: heme biosynthesis HemY N-terminal domain-containing protein [Casimicrobiaceae bacterium]|nr:heme biosynthesis HemY N-terminal domain-containing protein [Casimicrobiaceae bacterium]